MPIVFASVMMAYSFSGTSKKFTEGSLTIQVPPIPEAGIVRPPFFSREQKILIVFLRAKTDTAFFLKRVLWA